MNNGLKFKFNIQLFADDEQKDKSNDLLSYELLEKKYNELLRRVEKNETESARQFNDIKAVIRSGNTFNGQEKQDDNKEKNNKELQKRLFDDLSKR